MKGDNFIYVADNVITSEACQKIIDTFEYLHAGNLTYSRQDPENYQDPITKKDTSTNLAEMTLEGMGKGIYDTTINAIRSSILSYVEKYEVGMTQRNENGDYSLIDLNFKVQRTKPSEGYHVWHCENSSTENYGRVLTWILYLNDVKEGGETELLHLSERITPKEGRLAVFPAGWTHTHRGNPPLSNTKYVVTGWVAHK